MLPLHGLCSTSTISETASPFFVHLILTPVSLWFKADHNNSVFLIIIIVLINSTSQNFSHITLLLTWKLQKNIIGGSTGTIVKLKCTEPELLKGSLQSNKIRDGIASALPSKTPSLGVLNVNFLFYVIVVPVDKKKITGRDALPL